MSHLDLRRLSGSGRFIQIEFKTPRTLHHQYTCSSRAAAIRAQGRSAAE